MSLPTLDVLICVICVICGYVAPATGKFIVAVGTVTTASNASASGVRRVALWVRMPSSVAGADRRSVRVIAPASPAAASAPSMVPGSGGSRPTGATVKPIAGTEVGLEHDPSNEIVAKATTDREGNVTFGNLKPGRYRVVLTDKSKLTVPARVTISGTAAAPRVSEPIAEGQYGSKAYALGPDDKWILTEVGAPSLNLAERPTSFRGRSRSKSRAPANRLSPE